MRLSRENRLKKRDYDLVFKRGRRVKTEYFDLIALGGRDPVRKLGIVISRKTGNAVVRNRVKRRIREILRQESELFADGVVVAVLIKPRVTELPYGELRELIVAKLKEALANDYI